MFPRHWKPNLHSVVEIKAPFYNMRGPWTPDAAPAMGELARIGDRDVSGGDCLICHGQKVVVGPVSIVC